MSNLLSQIKNKLLESRRNRDGAKTVFYSTLLGELAAIGKNKGNRDTTDEEAVAHIRKWVNNLDSTMSLRGGVCTELLQEKKWCEEFLPTLLNENQLRSIIQDIIDKVGNNQGMVMKELKALYPGQYDGKMASTIYQNLK